MNLRSSWKGGKQFRKVGLVTDSLLIWSHISVNTTIKLKLQHSWHVYYAIHSQ